MTFPEPKPGLVIRYAYLWRSEAAAGREEAAKNRPCVIVLAVQHAKGRCRVYVAPVTHSPPQPENGAIEIPHKTKQRLGLDDLPSWIITTELNAFFWAGPDIRFLHPARPALGIAYGFLPYSLTEKLLQQVRENMRSGKARALARQE